MRFFQVITLASAAAAFVIEPRRGNGKGAATTSAAASAASSTATTGQTVVLKEVNGVPGNECLTFRNNGEIVDAACVNTAADRQMTPTTIGGQSVLRVQRTFTADFRPDLAGVADVCVGFNGTVFLAQDCSGVQPVVFTGGQLKTADGSACASGHDGKAQLTVDTSGKTCATYTATTVNPTAP